MTQELGTVVAVDGKLDFSKYPIGSTLKILPHHVSFSSMGVDGRVVSECLSLLCRRFDS
jgi:hypothetical protein